MLHFGARDRTLGANRERPHSMRRLYLHIGTHKTGTTSLQAYLLDHRTALQKQNINVITEKHRKFGEVGTCLGFAHGVLRNGLRTVARMTGDMPSSTSFKGGLYRRQVRRMLKRLPENASAILSAEALCFARTEDETTRLRKVFAGLEFDIVPVICFRNEHDWRASWESELRGWSDRMGQAFAKGKNDIRNDWYFDPQSILSFWEQFGEVRRVDFDKSVAEDGSVLPKLLAALDVPIKGNLDAYVLRQRHGQT